MQLGMIIKKKREEMGFSLQSLADSVGTCKSYLSDIERGRNKNIGFGLAIRLSFALSIPLHSLAAAFFEQLNKSKEG